MGAVKVAPPREQCFDCHRKAKWFGPLNRWTPPKLLCGYHKRAYTNVLRLLSERTS